MKFQHMIRTVGSRICHIVRTVQFFAKTVTVTEPAYEFLEKRGCTMYLYIMFTPIYVARFPRFISVLLEAWSVPSLKPVFFPFTVFMFDPQSDPKIETVIFKDREPQSTKVGTVIGLQMGNGPNFCTIRLAVLNLNGQTYLNSPKFVSVRFAVWKWKRLTVKIQVRYASRFRF